MELPVNGDVKYWSIPNVVQWLYENRMEVYSDAFRNAYVDGEKLLTMMTRPVLLEMKLHPTHIDQLLVAIETYNCHNPTNDYECESDEDSFGEEDDVDCLDSLTGPYESPDDIGPPPQRTGLHPLPPHPTDADTSGQSMPPLPPARPPKTSAVQSQPINHRPLPEPNRGWKDQPKKTSSGGSEHLQSLPEGQAPIPSSWRPGQRPPLAVPGGPQSAMNRPMKRPPISTVPIVPQGQYLGGSSEPEGIYLDADEGPPQEDCAESEDNYEVGIDDPPAQEEYEVVDSPLPSHTPKPFPGRVGPLLPTPTTSKPVGGTQNGPSILLPARPHNAGKKQYPLVTLPSQPGNAGSLAKDTKTKPNAKKKVIPSYTIHDLLPHNSEIVQRPPVTSRPPSNEMPPATTSRPKIMTPPTVDRSKATPPPETSGSSSNGLRNTSGLSVRERMAMLQTQGNTSVVAPQNPSKRPELVQEMMVKQNERNKTGKISEGIGTTERVRANIKPSFGKNALPTPLAVIAPRDTPVSPTAGPPAGRIPKAQPPLPKSTISTTAAPAPALPPMRRGSISTSSTGSADEERGLYNYMWYRSDIDRSTSMKQLKSYNNQQGVFIVRKSKKNASKPYTLDVLYDGFDFHIPLRLRPDGQFAMGTFQENEERWPSVPNLISFFETHQLVLTTSFNGQTIKKSTVLVERHS